MVHNTEINKYAMYIVFAPQPQKYIENIDKEMLNEAFSFYQQITFNKKNIVLIDMSSDPDFTRHDFQDGDHLNFKGAIKFIQKLQAYGITI
jgi:5'(3')-deoxyribonucleotidase